MSTRHPTHRSDRATNARSALRYWLSHSLSACRRSLATRPLICEPLERRYALHGGWMDHSLDDIEYQQTTVIYPDGTSAEVVQVRSIEKYGATNSRPEAKINDQQLRRTTRSFADNLETHAAEYEDCSHKPSGLGRAEGEAPLGRGPQVFANQIAESLRDSSPQVSTNHVAESLRDSSPRVNDLRETRNSSGSVFGVVVKIELPVSAEPQSSILSSMASAPGRSNGGSSNTASDTSSARSDNSERSSAVIATPRPAQPLRTVLDISSFTANSDSPALPRALDVASSKSANTSESAARFASSPVLNASKVDSVTVPLQNRLALSMNANTNQAIVSRELDSATDLAHVASTARERAGLKSTEASTDSNSGGALRQLQLAIEQLASHRQVEKSGEVNSKLTRGGYHQALAESNRSARLNDGLLELAPSSEKLLEVEQTGESASQVVEVRHRGQLIAALELNREFELAGQTQFLVQPIMRPARFTESAELAAEDWSGVAQESLTIAVDSVEGTQSESSWWQRSLLPLSFLAVGGLLLRSRKRYRINQTQDSRSNRSTPS